MIIFTYETIYVNMENVDFIDTAVDGNTRKLIAEYTNSGVSVDLTPFLTERDFQFSLRSITQGFQESLPFLDLSNLE